ncbi:DNA primase [Aestuariivirga litoralis]|uniref:DNA primase n=1 Tax=Aestuariivirga litoralis TaxID=2650924 RepID=A0A2W2AL88_9HYPH|nr:DNA primase [Aestuariivirga litoralis]PZF76141.1 DNA primase [Aestuariivirga litoralis]
MRVPPSFLEDIRGRVSISAVVGRKVAWDRRKSNPGKGDYWACCPFHGEKSPSFHVDDRKGRYHCFGCKASGDIFTFLVEKEGLSFPEAVERLAQEAGLQMPVMSEAERERETQRASLYDVMEMAAKFFEAELQAARGSRARGYLADRQLSPAIQKEFRLGYAPDDRSALRSHLADKGVPVEQMAEAGLVIAGDDIPVAYDRFRDRVMFPIRDPRGRVIAFGGRAMSKDVPAKYLNSPETPLFHKGQVLYNLDKARAPAHEKRAIIAVEGYVDVIAMHRAGLPHAVAPLGTALTEDQLRMLWKQAAEPILCFDGDGAGIKAAYRALDLALPLLEPGHSLRFALLPEGQDPDDLLKAQGPEAVREVVDGAQPLADMLWQRALDQNDRSTPERRAQFEKELRSLLNTIADDVVKKHYLAECGERMRALFAPMGGNRGPNTRRQAFGKTAGNRPFKPNMRPWDIQQPPTAGLRRLAAQATPQSGAERRERMIVLTLINHPELVHEVLDEFAGLEMVVPELDSLRTQIIDSAALGSGLDGTDLKAHLINMGSGPLLDRLETQAKRLNEWFLGSGAAQDDARTGLRQMIALHRKTITLERELRAAEAAFAADPTEEKLNALKAVREQLSSHAGSEAQIQGFGAASGRAVDAIT